VTDQVTDISLVRALPRLALLRISAVRRALAIPPSHTVVLAVSVGYADNTALTKTRLPLEGLVHRDQW